MTSADDNKFAVAMGLEREVLQLQTMARDWIEGCDPEMQEMLRWQFNGSAKYFRPITVYACYRAVQDGRVPAAIVRSAFAVEMLHNVSLIVDDILDRSRYRRQKLTLHCRYGILPALMAAGYIVAASYEMMCEDPFAVSLLSELLKRLGAAECLQWRLRRHPLNVEDWRMIACADTGSMFEVCACLGTRDFRLRNCGRLIGLLYHGCDDVGDMRGGKALGGGGVEDIRDGILTLPVALAIRDPEVASIFRAPSSDNIRHLALTAMSQLDEAEAYLDRVATEAIAEAQTWAKRPNILAKLIGETRKLSQA